MLPPLPVPPILGAEAVVAWFGMWPSFHDAEILSVHINRGATSVIRLHAWTMRQDEWVIDREAIVSFDLRGISSLQLQGEEADRQNVIDSLLVEATTEGYRIELVPCYGLSGEIVAEHVSVQIEREGPPEVSSA